MRSVVIGVLLAVLGCQRSGGGGFGDDDDDADGDADQAYARDACEEIVDAFATYAERCTDGEVDFTAYRSDFLDGCCCGSCDHITGIRDPDEFESQCVPWIEGLDCEHFLELEAGELDSSCANQLVRPLVCD